MTEIIIDNKRYFLVPEKNYLALQKKAAFKSRPEKTLTLDEARDHSRKLIRKWAGVK